MCPLSLFVSLLSHIHQRVDALGVEVEAKAERFKQANARRVVRVNESNKFEGGVDLFCKIAYAGEDFLRIALTLVIACYGDAERDAIFGRRDEKGERANGRSVVRGEEKTLNFRIGKQFIRLVRGDQFFDVSVGGIFPSLITCARFVLSESFDKYKVGIRHITDADSFCDKLCHIIFAL